MNPKTPEGLKTEFPASIGKVAPRGLADAGYTRLKQLTKVTEAELLKILADHRNFTLERKVIMLQIWGDDSFFNSRNLDVYITRLRDYLREDERVQIITLKGVGYQFIVD